VVHPVKSSFCGDYGTYLARRSWAVRSQRYVFFSVLGPSKTGPSRPQARSTQQSSSGTGSLVHVEQSRNQILIALLVQGDLSRWWSFSGKPTVVTSIHQDRRSRREKIAVPAVQPERSTFRSGAVQTWCILVNRSVRLWAPRYRAPGDTLLTVNHAWGQGKSRPSLADAERTDVR